MRIQLALNVDDLDAAVAFYSKLFDVPVHKRKPGYANFSIAEPPMKLVLFENPGATERLNHLGVEVFDDADVRAATDRLRAVGLADSVEDEQTCCYATQNKVWARDPQGMPWEFYRIVEDAEAFGSGGSFEPAATSEPAATPESAVSASETDPAPRGCC
jgi:catechol 2,3-dioxygenase-like lactoylglutathione lyase family enzyme